jgi:acyl-CoA synthetase (AMP-forming)/AMP-acid ligase II
MVITGGENVHPAEVEDVLLAHPAVADVGVVGRPDDEWGEAVTAFVHLDTDATVDELNAWCLESDDLDDFKRPRAYEFVDEIPRNPSGKVMRYLLREDE